MKRLWNLPVLRLIATDRCRVAAPWFGWSSGDDDASLLRRRANALEREQLGATHPLEQSAAAMLHLLFSGPRILLAMNRWGRALRLGAGVSYLRQFGHLCLCSWHVGLRPQVYYYLQLHRLPRLETWRQVIDPAELHYLQRDISSPDVDAMEDKLRFAERAAAQRIPTVPYLAAWENGERLETPGQPAADLRRSIFVKRSQSYSSIGVMGFRFNPVTGVHHDDRHRYTMEELAATLARASMGTTLLVQPWLRNHADLAGFSQGALCNFRIVTGRHPDGRTEVLLAALRFPLSSELTCAERDITLCAGVNLATGRLHAAQSKDPRLGLLPRHPGTGQQIENFPVPRWPEMVALACAAHEAWPEFPFIGWDLSDTADGLFFLEGGCLWGGFLAQMAGNPPLGLTAFSEIYHAHLARRSSAIPRPCPILANA